MSSGRVWTVFVAVVGCLLAAGCTDTANAPEPGVSGPPPERDYWPTDGWRTADPADHGFDSDELAALESLVTDPYTTVRSVVIVRDGYLIYEHYGRGLEATAGHDIRSVTKSVVSALLGIALADGSVDSLDRTVGELFGDRVPAGADPRTAGVTVRHLLSMTSGLPADDRSLGGDEKVIQQIEGSPDSVRAILGLPLAAEPGSMFAYSSLTSDLLSVIVADATGKSTLDFARERLFRPLGIHTENAYAPVVVGPPTREQIEEYDRAATAWPADPQGYQFGGGGLKLPARDLAKFGFLYLNEGRWEDEQIVPADYVRASTTPGEVSTGRGEEYGWQWWITRAGDGFFARGYGGQVIEVVPHLDMVAVVTCDPEVPRGDGHGLVTGFILPAAEG
jgi:CubicO group peptidase (beta-lactamase class C family)